MLKWTFSQYAINLCGVCTSNKPAGPIMVVEGSAVSVSSHLSTLDIWWGVVHHIDYWLLVVRGLVGCDNLLGPKSDVS